MVLAAANGESKETTSVIELVSALNSPVGTKVTLSPDAAALPPYQGPIEVINGRKEGTPVMSHCISASFVHVR
jgi:hypothetical protein